MNEELLQELEMRYPYITHRDQLTDLTIYVLSEEGATMEDVHATLSEMNRLYAREQSPYARALLEREEALRERFDDPEIAESLYPNESADDIDEASEF